MAGFCDEIRVILHSDNSVSVFDNGRGIPVDIHEKSKIPAVQLVMTSLHAGGKFDSSSYKISGGLNGVGASVVNALSEKLHIEIQRDGNLFRQSYAKGVPTSELNKVEESSKTGTYIHFYPDSSIFEDIDFRYEQVLGRVRELAFLNKGLKIYIKDEKSEKEKDFYFEGGIKTFVEEINAHKTVLFPEPIYITKDMDGMSLEICLQYNDTYNSQILSYANNIHTIEGGTHDQGFRQGLLKVITQYGTENKLLNAEDKLMQEDIKEGLIAIISIKLTSPQYESQKKIKLTNSEVRGFVDKLTVQYIHIFLEENPDIAKRILAKT